MRPIRLDMDGFAAFREPTTIDFTDADYFVLVGATGSGKSTVIDAMIFALYGSVPRWSDRRAVMYGLAPTAVRGTVRLLFEVGGQRYVVARELRRAKAGGVNVRNARLDRLRDPQGAVDSDAVSIASDSGTSGAVERLLGLTFEHFCQCVVLPQGAFSEFLRAKGSDRRAILLQLLGATLYGDMQRAANVRAAQAASRVATLDDGIATLGDATDAAVAAAQARLDTLHTFETVVRRSVENIGALAARRAESAGTRDRLAVEHAALIGVAPPSDLDDLETASAAAGARAAEVEDAAVAAEAADSAARSELAAAPARGPLESAVRRHRELSDLTARLPSLTAARTGAAATLIGAQQTREAAVAATQAARAGRDRAATEADAAQRAVLTIDREVQLLATVQIPSSAAVVDATLREATAAHEAAAAERAAAERSESDARDALLAAPARQPLLDILKTLTELDALRRERTVLAAQLDTAVSTGALTAAALADAERTRNTAAARHDSAVGADRAATLVPLLVVGQTCPVCRQAVGHLPEHVPPAGLADAEAALTAAQGALAAARSDAGNAAAELAAARARVGSTDARLASLSAQLGEPPPGAAEIRAELTAVDALDAALAAAGAAVGRVRGAEQRAAAAHRTAVSSSVALATALHAARDPLVSLGAPAVDEDAFAGWTRLAAWATAQVAARTQALGAARDADVVAAVALGAATTALHNAEDAEAAAHTAENRATAAAEQAAAALDTANDRLAVVTAELVGAPDLVTATATLARLDEFAVAAQSAGAAMLLARRLRQEAAAAAAGVARRYEAAWQQLRSARDPLVALGAPELPAGTVSAAWTALTGWAADAASIRATDRDTAGAEVDRLGIERSGAVQELQARFVALDLSLGTEDPTTTAVPAVAAAVARAQAAHAQTVVRRAEATELAARRDRAVDEQRVAAELSRLLRSNNFPEWLEASALDALVADGSQKLEQLSNRQFALTHRDGEFFVVDHADADSLRSVRTLSGGETFQASLSLALALSAQLSDMAAAGAARLDSIFLDEGFGTLDANSLDVVAETLETLARGDRMVGIITHVPALADRVPVRFLVRRDDRSSRVEREDV